MLVYVKWKGKNHANLIRRREERERELVTWQVDAGEVQEVIRSQASNAPSTRPVNNTDDLEALQHPPRSCQGERGVRGGRK